MRRALITGILGQDGAYLARLLLNKGYHVHGAYRRTSSLNTWRLSELGILDHPNFTLFGSDVTDPGSCIRLLELARPQEVYNLAGQSFVGVSFDQPLLTTQIDGIGVLNLLEAIRTVDRTIRFYQASTAEMFGLVQSVPQTEETPFYPRSPYGVAKLYGHGMAINYRESYGIFAACGILFNHESPLRGMEFVTRKISDAVARVAVGGDFVLELGNLEAQRDWGYADDYVEGMWRLLQADKPDVCIFATGHTRSVRDFTNMAFEAGGLGLTWRGSGDDEHAVCTNTKRVVVRVAPHLRRPAEVDLLIGSYAKAERTLGWRPKTALSELCAMMVDADIARHRKLHEGAPKPVAKRLSPVLVAGELQRSTA